MLFLESRGYGAGVLAAYGGADSVHGLLRSSWKDWIWIDTCLLSSLWSLFDLCQITGSEYPILLFPAHTPLVSKRDSCITISTRVKGLGSASSLDY